MRIIDPEESARLKDRALRLHGRTGLLDCRTLLERNWACVPVANQRIDWRRSGPYFDLMEAERLATALAAIGCPELISVPLDESGESVIAVAADPLSIFQWSDRTTSNECLLLTENESFAALCTWDYNLIAGPRSFVERVVGTDLQSARNDFVSNIESVHRMEGDDPIGARLAEALVSTALHDGCSVKAVEDIVELGRLRRVWDELMEDEFRIRRDVLEGNGWAVALVDKGRHVSITYAHRLTRVARTVGSDLCHAIGASGEDTTAFRFRINEERLVAFSRQGSSSQYLIVPDNRAFLFLCTVEEFNVVAGPKDVIEAFLACSLSAAWAEFRRAFLYPEIDPSYYRFYSGLAEYYEPFGA